MRIWGYMNLRSPFKSNEGAILDNYHQWYGKGTCADHIHLNFKTSISKSLQECKTVLTSQFWTLYLVLVNFMIMVTILVEITVMSMFIILVKVIVMFMVNFTQGHAYIWSLEEMMIYDDMIRWCDEDMKRVIWWYHIIVGVGYRGMWGYGHPSKQD